MHDFCREASVKAAHQVLVAEGDWERYKGKYEEVWGPMKLDFLRDEEELSDELVEVGANEQEVDDPAFEQG